MHVRMYTYVLACVDDEIVYNNQFFILIKLR